MGASEGRRLPHAEVGTAGREGRVIIVEDEAVICLDLTRRLRRLGYDVIGVADCHDDALALVAAQRPDLVLMDISLRGDVDGIETARDIGRLCDVPVVFMSAFVEPHTVRRASAVSPYGYVVKPFNEGVLSVTLTLALQRHAGDQRTRTLGAAVESASVGIALIDAHTGLVTFVNSALVTLSALSFEAWIGRPPSLLGADEADEGAVRLRHAIRTRAAADVTLPGRRADGAPLWASVGLSIVPTRAGVAGHLLLFFKDITAQRAAESALADAQRIETIGRMTAGIAHDFNNVLGAIVAFAEFVRDGHDETARHADADEILHAARRGAMLTRKLLDYSRTFEGATGCADLGDVVDDTRVMVERLAGPRVRVELHREPGPTPVNLDATSIEQVLLNLVANARDAMPGGGRVTVRVERTPGPDGAVRARLSVSDTGTGIDAQTLKRIFDPLFTTKPRGRGTGLGLSTSRMLVERGGGAITVQTAPSEGTTFAVELPMSAMVVAPDEPLDVAASGDAAGACCLIVEDEPALRSACLRALSDAGFLAVAVSSVEAAQRELDARGAAVRVVVCDMVLDGEHGSSLLAYAREAVPGARALVVTGYTDEDAFPLGDGYELLRKPFTMNALVRRALDLLGHSARPRRSEPAAR